MITIALTLMVTSLVVWFIGYYFLRKGKKNVVNTKQGTDDIILSIICWLVATAFELAGLIVLLIKMWKYL